MDVLMHSAVKHARAWHTVKMHPVTFPLSGQPVEGLLRDLAWQTSNPARRGGSPANLTHM